MQENKAVEIHDYISDHQDDKVADIAKHFDIPLEEMEELAFMWSTPS